MLKITLDILCGQSPIKSTYIDTIDLELSVLISIHSISC